MMSKWLKTAMAMAACVALLTGAALGDLVKSNLSFEPAAANVDSYPDFGQGVNNSKQVAPSPAGSNINNYTFQDEQIGIGPDDGTVLVLRTDQKNNVQDYVSAVIPLKNVTPREIRNMFRTVMGKEGGTAEVIRDKVKNENSLFVVGPAWMLPSVIASAQALDESWVSEWNDGSQDLFYKAKFRPVEAVDAIASNWGGTLGWSSFDTTNDTVLYQDEAYRIESYLKGAKLADIPEHQINVEGAIYDLNVSNDLKLGLDYIAWKNGPGRNLFDFLWAGEDNEENFRRVNSVFNPALAGIEFPFYDGRYRFHPGSHWEFTKDTEQLYSSFNFLLTAAYLDFLQSKGRAKVLAKINVSGTSGRTATWTNVDQLLSFEKGYLIDNEGNIDDNNITLDPNRGSYTSGVAPDPVDRNVYDQFNEVNESEVGRVFPYGYGQTSVEPRVLRYVNSGQTGMFMDILPQIGTETTELRVDFAAADLTGYTPQGTPIVDTRTLLTTVRVKDGVPFVLGGIRRTEKIKTKQGVPWLSAVPVVGWLFGGESSIDRENDMAIVLTPHMYIGAESDMQMPAIAQTVKNQANDEAELALPKNAYGFDMWLLNN